MLDRHLFIIGMPGSGKSSLGKRLAKETGLPFTDTDGLIVQTCGGTVASFFEAYGEEAFRRAETNTLIALSRARPMIVSTGGGLAMNPVNREIMRNHGTILLLDRPLENILSDIKLDRRPTLQEKGLPEVERLYYERMPVYRALADFRIVNTDYRQAVSALVCLVKEWC